MDDRNDYKCKMKEVHMCMNHIQLNITPLYCCSCHSPGTILPLGSIFVLFWGLLMTRMIGYIVKISFYIYIYIYIYMVEFTFISIFI